MKITSQTSRILCEAYKIYENQLDITGLPYIFAVYHLAESMIQEEQIHVALLCSGFEDGSISLARLEELELSEPEIAALQILKRSRKDGEKEYLAKVSANPLAKSVKTAQLQQWLEREIRPDKILKLNADLHILYV